MGVERWERGWAAVVHLGILFSWVGMVGTLVVLLWQRDHSAFVADHAKQALAYQLAVFCVLYLSSLALAGSLATGLVGLERFLGSASILSLMVVVTTAVAMWASVTALKGVRCRYPVIGRLLQRV